MCVWVPRSAHLLLLPPSRQPGWIIYTISGRVFKIKGLQLGLGGRKCSNFFCIFGTIWMCLITVTASQHVALRSTISNTNIQPILSWQLKCLQACWSPSKTRTMCPRECVWQITKKMQEVSNSYAFILEARQVPVLPYADFCCLDVLLLVRPATDQRLKSAITRRSGPDMHEAGWDEMIWAAAGRMSAGSQSSSSSSSAASPSSTAAALMIFTPSIKFSDSVKWFRGHCPDESSWQRPRIWGVTGLYFSFLSSKVINQNSC